MRSGHEALYSPPQTVGGGAPRGPTEGKSSQLGSLDVLAHRVRGPRSALMLSGTLHMFSSCN